MKIPHLSTASVAQALWPELSRQAATKRLERNKISAEEYARMRIILKAHIKAVADLID